MNKLITTILIALLTFSFQSVDGQQVYQLKHYGGPGTIYLYNRITGVIQTPAIALAGANVTWDLNASTDLNTHATEIVTPGEAIDQFTFLTICALSGNSAFDCFTTWSNTEQALLLQDTITLLGLSLVNLQRYQDKASNRLLENFFGFTVDFQGTPTAAVIVYQNPDTILQFPVTYGDDWTSVINWMIDLSPAGQNIMYSSKQTRTTSVDAWGTVETPYDTFTNVVRVRSEVHHQDTLFTDTLDVPVNFTQVEYMWFDTSYKIPVMVATGVVTDTLEIINVVEYIYEATCPAPTWFVATDQDTYYLDASGSVTVNFVITDSNADEYTWDLGGGTIVTSSGSISYAYEVADSYAVAVNGCMTNCLPINSCSFQIVDFVVLDTITAVPVIPGEELGIRLYPNPVKESMIIEIPVILGDQAYQIVDITGRKVDEGLLHIGFDRVHTDSLQNGVYNIHLLNQEGERKRIAILRFIVLD